MADLERFVDVANELRAARASDDLPRRQRAIRLLYELTMGLARSVFARDRLQDDEVRDLVHDVVLNVSKAEAFETHAYPGPYVVTALRRVRIDSFREAQRDRKLATALSDGDVGHVHAMRPDERIAKRQVLERLPERHRQILVATTFMERDDVAKAFGLTPGNVDRIVSRARVSLEEVEAAFEQAAAKAGE